MAPISLLLDGTDSKQQKPAAGELYRQGKKDGEEGERTMVLRPPPAPKTWLGFAAGPPMGPSQVLCKPLH